MINVFPKPYADLVARLRVPFGFVLVIAFAWLSQPSLRSLALGIPVGILGLIIRAWAAGHLEKNMRLAETGPYAYVRNPLYIGTLFVAAGLAIASRRWILGVLFAAVFFLIYLPVIELEEQHLRKLFPAYVSYAQRVPGLIPAFRSKNGAGHFRWKHYMRNEEYQAALGFLAGVIFLVCKLFL